MTKTYLQHSWPAWVCTIPFYCWGLYDTITGRDPADTQVWLLIATLLYIALHLWVYIEWEYENTEWEYENKA